MHLNDIIGYNYIKIIFIFSSLYFTVAQKKSEKHLIYSHISATRPVKFLRHLPQRKRHKTCKDDSVSRLHSDKPPKQNVHYKII